MMSRAEIGNNSFCDHFLQKYEGMKIANRSIGDNWRKIYFVLLTRRKRQFNPAQKLFQTDAFQLFYIMLTLC